MAEIIWSNRAITDLNSIAEYISLDSEYAAKKFVNQLMQKADKLLSYPEMGRPIPEKIPGNFRQILYKSYRIIYKLENEKIIISAVYHQRKLLLKIIKDD